MPSKGLFIFLLFFLFLRPSQFSDQIDSYILRPGPEVDLSIGLDVDHFQLVCPFMKPVWFLPPTVSPDLQPHVVRLLDNKASSHLYLSLPASLSDRASMRGYYTCCSGLYISSTSGERLQRTTQPICCPCCDWPEQETCGTFPSIMSNSTNDKDQCLRVFVYTGCVDTAEVQLSPSWQSQVLIPCPLPRPHTMPFPLRIYSQINKIPASISVWYPGQVGTYDPRLGLCTNQTLIHQPYLVRVCEYAGGIRRIIKVKQPSSPPTLPPTVHLTLSRPPSKDLTKVPAFPEPVFRVDSDGYIVATCEAAYTNIFIVRLRPRLCFRWRIVSNVGSGWLPYECLQTWRSLTDIMVVARHRYRFKTQGNTSIIVECEVVEDSRKTPMQNVRVRIEPVAKSLDLILESLNPENDGYYIFQNTTSSNASALVVLNDTLSRVALYFFSSEEISANASCSVTSMGKVTNMTHLQRTHDRWMCTIILPRDQRKLSVQLRQGELKRIVSVYPTPISLLPEYSISRQHDFADIDVNLTCKGTTTDIDERVLAFSKSVNSVRWLVYTDGSLFLNSTLNNSIGFETFRIPAFINLSLIPQGPLFTVSNRQPSDNFFELTSALQDIKPPHLPFAPHQICITCEVQHSIGVKKSPLTCWKLRLSRELNMAVNNSRKDERYKVSPDFKPTLLMPELGNETMQSFFIQYAFPVRPSAFRNGSVHQLTVFEASRLELSCRVPRSMRHVGRWPLILTSGSNSSSKNFILPAARVSFYIIPCCLETRLVIDSVRNTSVGNYFCWQNHTSRSRQTALNVTLESNYPPTVVEPNRPVRYFTPGELIRLLCKARGKPAPIVIWRVARINGNNSSNLHNLTQLEVLQECNSFTNGFSRDASVTTCSFAYAPSNFTKNVSLECVAINLAGNVTSVLSLIGIGASGTLKYSIIINRIMKSYVFWIIVPLVLIIVLFTCLAVCLCRKSKKMAKAKKLIKMENLLYQRPTRANYYPGNQGIGREFIQMLMPTQELQNKWCLEKSSLKTLPRSLGTGHYGSVLKGLYTKSDHLTGISDSFFVAIKTPSTELSSLTCFRNEIAHLMRLSGGPNIVKLIGCIFGESDDLSDTQLVLEFCANTSLSDYIRRAFLPKPYFGLQASSFHTTSTLSTRLSSTTTMTYACERDSTNGYLGSYVSVHSPAYQVWSNQYQNADAGNSRRRRGRLQTSFIYQHMEHDYVSFLLQVAVDVSRGLEFLSKKLIIHRDIATRNILLDSSLKPKICDFGLAVTVNSPGAASDGSNGTSSGYYRIITFAKQLPFRILPPEALSKQMFYLSSDVWEFGLLLWQMFFLESRKPFDKIQTTEALLLLLTQVNKSCPMHSVDSNASQNRFQSLPTVDRPPNLPDAVWGLMCACWRLLPEKRPSATEIRQCLEEITSLPTTADGTTGSNGNRNFDSRPDISYQILQRSNLVSDTLESTGPSRRWSSKNATPCLQDDYLQAPYLRTYENLGSRVCELGCDDEEDYLEARERHSSI